MYYLFDYGMGIVDLSDHGQNIIAYMTWVHNIIMLLSVLSM